MRCYFATDLVLVVLELEYYVVVGSLLLVLFLVLDKDVGFG